MLQLPGRKMLRYFRQNRAEIITTFSGNARDLCGELFIFLLKLITRLCIIELLWDILYKRGLIMTLHFDMNICHIGEKSERGLMILLLIR